MIDKTIRIENKNLLEAYRKMPCAVCYCSGYGTIVAHHIKTKGSGGHDHYQNLIPLCHEHHRETHDKGLKHMVAKYENVKDFLQFIEFKFEGAEIIFPEIK